MTDAPPSSHAPLSILEIPLARELADRLADGGIDVRLAPEPRAPSASARGGYAGRTGRLVVLVPEPDLERARSIESRLVRESVPDLPEDFDPEAQAEGQCPACQTPLPEQAAECAECGLCFPS